MLRVLMWLVLILLPFDCLCVYDDEEDDAVSIDHLSEGEDELRECRQKNLQKKFNKENPQPDDTHVPRPTQSPTSANDCDLGPSEIPHNTQPSSSQITPTGEGSQPYVQVSFLTELCADYNRGNFVEKEITSDPEVKVEIDEDGDGNEREWPIHNPKTHWKKVGPYLGERRKIGSTENVTTRGRGIVKTRGGSRVHLGATVSYDPVAGEATVGSTHGVPLPAWPRGVSLPSSLQEAPSHEPQVEINVSRDEINPIDSQSLSTMHTPTKRSTSNPPYSPRRSSRLMLKRGFAGLKDGEVGSSGDNCIELD